MSAVVLPPISRSSLMREAISFNSFISLLITCGRMPFRRFLRRPFDCKSKSGPPFASGIRSLLRSSAGPGVLRNSTTGGSTPVDDNANSNRLCPTHWHVLYQKPPAPVYPPPATHPAATRRFKRCKWQFFSFSPLTNQKNMRYYSPVCANCAHNQGGRATERRKNT